MGTYSNGSKAKLSTTALTLQIVMEEVIKTIDNTILYGYRSPKEQFELYKQGRVFIDGIWRIQDKRNVVTYCDGTTTPSNHNMIPSNAIDCTPFPVDWKDTQRLYYFAGFVMATALRLKEEGKVTEGITWGGNWDNDDDLRDQTFMDLCHFEIRK
jgi:peptidoglycan L-alanyl-D-glutamate endopeptidase CwlK